MRKGQVQVYTGDGKGKTTAALGLALRAIGQGFKVYIIQYMKGGAYTGEFISAKNYLPNIEMIQFGRPCIKQQKQMKIDGFSPKGSINKTIFDFVDDHRNLSSHMSKSSWMMGGGRMEVSTDSGHGQKIGSHICLSGSAFGIPINLDEVVTQYQKPRIKVWETVGAPKLLVVGQYQMKIEIQPQDGKSHLSVSIDYKLPDKNAWLGKLFGKMYAKWCVKQMINGARIYLMP